jgi:branched-chain amino acid aminotransferase
MSEAIAYYDGRLVPESEARLPVQNPGVVRGAMASDFVRTFRHRLFRLPDHLVRFRASCAYLGIPLVADEELTRAAEEVVAHNAAQVGEHAELVLILLATPGPTLILYTYPLSTTPYAIFFQTGARLVVPPTRQVPAACIDPRVKHRSRLHWWRAQLEVRRIEPGAQALLQDLNGHVTETALANFLIVRDGQVLTAPRSSVLNGVSLQVTQELCAELGLAFEERPLTLVDCRTADEALLTGTAFCLAGVSRLDGTALPWPGPVTEALAAAWSRYVGLDYRRQILAAR